MNPNSCLFCRVDCGSQQKIVILFNDLRRGPFAVAIQQPAHLRGKIKLRSICRRLRDGIRHFPRIYVDIGATAHLVNGNFHAKIP